MTRRYFVVLEISPLRATPLSFPLPKIYTVMSKQVLTSEEHQRMILREFIFRRTKFSKYRSPSPMLKYLQLTLLINPNLKHPTLIPSTKTNPISATMPLFFPKLQLLSTQEHPLLFITSENQTSFPITTTFPFIPPPHSIIKNTPFVPSITTVQTTRVSSITVDALVNTLSLWSSTLTWNRKTSLSSRARSRPGMEMERIGRSREKTSTANVRCWTEIRGGLGLRRRVEFRRREKRLWCGIVRERREEREG